MKLALAVLALVACAMATPFDLKEIQQKTILDGKLCHACEGLAKKAEGLGEEEAKKVINEGIAAACAELGFFAGECRKELDKVVDKLVDQLVNEAATPEKACQEVDFCKK